MKERTINWHQFLSTLSLRRATGISTIFVGCSRDFYPRSPCGERPIFAVRPYDAPIFLSTLSLRRATSAPDKNNGGPGDFYPRSPCGERRIPQNQLSANGNFYPRSPCGERLDAPIRVLGKARISIHALLAESDGTRAIYTHTRPDFYPRSPCGERQDNTASRMAAE